MQVDALAKTFLDDIDNLDEERFQTPNPLIVISDLDRALYKYHCLRTMILLQREPFPDFWAPAATSQK